MTHRIAVIQHASSLLPLDLVYELRRSATPLWVLGFGPPVDDRWRRLLARTGEVVDLGDDDLDGAARAVACHRPDGIVSFADNTMAVTAELAARLGLPGHEPSVAATLTDKRLQRAALRRSGVPGPTFWPIPDGAGWELVRRISAAVAYPAVVKPAAGTGSVGIVRVDDAGELLMALGAEPGRGWLVEAYLPDDETEAWLGSYVSVESVVAAGHVDHVAVTGRFPLAAPFRETGNFTPGLLAADDREAVFEMASAAIEAIGVTDAMVHTEVKLSDRGPRMIEVNGRLGGRPPSVLKAASGTNLYETACLVAAGVRPAVTGVVPCAAVGFWLMLQPPMAATRLTSVSGLEDCARLEGVDSVEMHVAPGGAVDWQLGTGSRVVTVRGRVPDHATLARTRRQIDEVVRLGYEEKPA